MPVITGHIAMQTRVQDWTRVCILTGPVTSGHWTEVRPSWTRVHVVTCPVITDHWTEVGPLKEKETFSTISCISNSVKIFEP